jgi:P-type Cu2+ transporter
VAAATQRGIPLAPARPARAVPGCGIFGDADGHPVAAGSGTWLGEIGWQVPAELARRARGLEAAGNSVIHIGWAGQVRGVLALGDALLPEARATVQALRRLGMQTLLLTGDRAEIADRIATEIGVDGCEAGLSPEAKRAFLERWRGRGGTVAMVGDGLNDGPVLATDLARETASIVLPQGGLRLLPWVIELSWAVRRTILTNLLWAFGYNAIGLALAVSGHLQPVLAAVLMAGSSLLVVLNSLRLERFAEPPNDPKQQDARTLEQSERRPRSRPPDPAPREAA